MDTKEITNKISLCEKDENINITTEVFESIRIKENMPNIEKILLQKTNAIIKNIAIKNSKFILKGILEINILYMGENEEIYSIRKNIDFYQTLCEGEKWDKLYNLEINIKSCELRIIKKRRIEVSANIIINGICILGKNINILNENGGEIFEIKNKNQRYFIFDINSTKENYTFKKDIPLKDSLNILYINANLRDISTNASSVGILYNAKAEFNIIYKIGYDEDAELKYEKVTYPINHFIEKEPKFICDYYCVNAFIENINAEYVTQGEDSYIQLTMDIISNTLFCQKKEIKTIEDIYSVNKNLSPVLKEDKVLNFKKGFERSLNIKENKPLNNTDLMGDIIDYTDTIKYTYSISHGIINIKGTIDIDYCAFINNDEKFYIDKVSLPFEISQESDFLDSDDIFLKILTDKMDIIIKNQTLFIEGEILLKTYAFENKNIITFEGINEDEKKDECADNIKINVYYKSDDESLWDIGKKHSIKVERIKAINNIENENEMPKSIPLIIR